MSGSATNLIICGSAVDVPGSAAGAAAAGEAVRVAAATSCFPGAERYMNLLCTVSPMFPIIAAKWLHGTLSTCGTCHTRMPHSLRTQHPT